VLLDDKRYLTHVQVVLDDIDNMSESGSVSGGRSRGSGGGIPLALTAVDDLTGWLQQHAHIVAYSRLSPPQHSSLPLLPKPTAPLVSRQTSLFGLV
jgi:hypothetical protein